jgi:hypothetical protein
MKSAINFILEDSKEIKGYDNILVTNIHTIINGYVDDILCECLDQLEIDTRKHVLDEILNKLAFEGRAVFKFVNATLLADRIIKNELDTKKLSSIIRDIKSLWSEYVILDMFNSIPSIKIDNYYNEGVNTVITLSKTA